MTKYNCQVNVSNRTLKIFNLFFDLELKFDLVNQCCLNVTLNNFGTLEKKNHNITVFKN